MILKGKSLNERCQILKIATDMPAVNRSDRRDSLKLAVRNRKHIKVVTVEPGSIGAKLRKLVGTIGKEKR